LKGIDIPQVFKHIVKKEDSAKGDLKKYVKKGLALDGPGQRRKLGFYD
jgi:hypothetical protein